MQNNMRASSIVDLAAVRRHSWGGASTTSASSISDQSPLNRSVRSLSFELAQTSNLADVVTPNVPSSNKPAAKPLVKPSRGSPEAALRHVNDQTILDFKVAKIPAADSTTSTSNSYRFDLVRTDNTGSSSRFLFINYLEISFEKTGEEMKVEVEFGGNMSFCDEGVKARAHEVYFADWLAGVEAAYSGEDFLERSPPKDYSQYIPAKVVRQAVGNSLSVEMIKKLGLKESFFKVDVALTQNESDFFESIQFRNNETEDRIATRIKSEWEGKFGRLDSLEKKQQFLGKYLCNIKQSNGRAVNHFFTLVGQSTLGKPVEIQQFEMSGKDFIFYPNLNR